MSGWEGKSYSKFQKTNRSPIIDHIENEKEATSKRKEKLEKKKRKENMKNYVVRHATEAYISQGRYKIRKVDPFLLLFFSFLFFFFAQLANIFAGKNF